METTLIVNPGSTSKKYAFYQDGRSVMLLRYEHVADDHVLCIELATGKQDCESITPDTYAGSLADAIKRAEQETIISKASDIADVAIRVVAPGTFFQYHRKIDENYITILKGQINKAPLHIPTLLREIEVASELLPDACMVGVSDSAFHNSMPEVTRRYSIDREDADALDLYRFGYHGLSVASVAERAHSIFGTNPERMVVMHVGGGVSVTALKNGRTFDTSMGYNPGSGLIMSSRAGDLDTGAMLELMRGKHMRLHDMHAYLQTKGGLWGIAGEQDLRVIMQQWSQGDQHAAEALSMFIYHLQMRVGAYMAGMGGLDTIILTATAAERNFELRHKLLSGLACLGVDLDEDRNDRLASSEGIITTPESPIKVAVIRTNEMRQMFYEVEQFKNATHR